MIPLSIYSPPLPEQQLLSSTSSLLSTATPPLTLVVAARLGFLGCSPAGYRLPLLSSLSSLSIPISSCDLSTSAGYMHTFSVPSQAFTTTPPTKFISRCTNVRVLLRLDSPNWVKFPRTGRNSWNLAMSTQPNVVVGAEPSGRVDNGVGEKDGVIIVDHGSRRQESNLMLNEFVAMFRARTGYWIVEPAHMVMSLD